MDDEYPPVRRLQLLIAGYGRPYGEFGRALLDLFPFLLYNIRMAKTVDDKKIIYTMDRVSRAYGTKVVLKDISISYYLGAKIGVIGENGAGKSSLFKIFAGIDKDYTGETRLLDGYTMGVIGVGNVGSRVSRMAKYLGFNVLQNDPPRMEAEGPDEFCSLEELLEQSRIVTLHVPLLPTTRAMADDAFFARMQPGTIFINASRGEVVDDEALKRAIPRLGPVIIDTWNNEPAVDLDLLGMVDIATPHIAGYSYQGKQNGTAAAVRAVARFFGIDPLFEFFPKTEQLNLESIKLDLKGKPQGEVTSVLQYNYPIFTDDFMFRMAPERFEQIRSNYQYRREFYTD